MKLFLVQCILKWWHTLVVDRISINDVRMCHLKMTRKRQNVTLYLSGSNNWLKKSQLEMTENMINLESHFSFHELNVTKTVTYDQQ